MSVYTRPSLNTFKEAITALEDVALACYSEYKGLGDVALSVASNVDKIADVQYAIA